LTLAASLKLFEIGTSHDKVRLATLTFDTYASGDV
jgi:hypothetical protein